MSGNFAQLVKLDHGMWTWRIVTSMCRLVEQSPYSYTSQTGAINAARKAGWSL